MPINLGAIRSELLPGLFDVRGYYEQIPTQYTKVFKTHTSKMAEEFSTQMAFTALPQFKKEGGATKFDNNAGERWKWNFIHYELGLGYSITRPAIDDNLYKAQFNPTNLRLADKFQQFSEIQAANIFNNAGTYDTNAGGDGVSLANTAHPYDGGSWGNRFSTDLDLNEASLLQGMLNTRSNFVDERGTKILARARQLLVPVALEPTAIRLTKTELRPGTANNDVNAILTTSGGLPEGHMVMDFFTSSFAWFLKTNIEGLIHMLRIPYEMDMWVDNITDNLLVKGYKRESFGYNDPRCVYASLPTS